MKINKMLILYSGGKLLKVRGKFRANAKILDAVKEMTFYVIDGKECPLLGKDSTMLQNVLIIGLNVNS